MTENCHPVYKIHQTRFIFKGFNFFSSLATSEGSQEKEEIVMLKF